MRYLRIKKCEIEPRHSHSSITLCETISSVGEREQLYVSSRAGKGVKVVGMLISSNFLNGRGEMSASAKLEV